MTAIRAPEEIALDKLDNCPCTVTISWVRMTQFCWIVHASILLVRGFKLGCPRALGSNTYRRSPHIFADLQAPMDTFDVLDGLGLAMTGISQPKHAQISVVE